MRSKMYLLAVLGMFLVGCASKPVRSDTPTSLPSKGDEIILTRLDWLQIRQRQEANKAERKRLRQDLEACERRKDGHQALPWVLLGVSVLLGGAIITSQALQLHKKP